MCSMPTACSRVRAGPVQGVAAGWGSCAHKACPQKERLAVLQFPLCAACSMTAHPATPSLPSVSAFPMPLLVVSTRPSPAVDDGEPRSMNDPANLPFMEAIMRGQLPPELDPGDPSVQVRGDGAISGGRMEWCTSCRHHAWLSPCSAHATPPGAPPHLGVFPPRPPPRPARSTSTCCAARRSTSRPRSPRWAACVTAAEPCSDVAVSA